MLLMDSSQKEIDGGHDVGHDDLDKPKGQWTALGNDLFKAARLLRHHQVRSFAQTVNIFLKLPIYEMEDELILSNNKA